MKRTARLHLLKTSALIVPVLLVVALYSTSLAGQLLSNLGWQYFAKSMFGHTSVDTSLNYFAASISLRPTNMRSYLGAGMASAEVPNELQALSYWRVGGVEPARLNELGQQMNFQGHHDTTFIYFRSASTLDVITPSVADFNLGRLCQQSLHEIDRLANVNQQYCLNYFADNQDNLLLDGQFEQTIDWGWTGEFLFTDTKKAEVLRDLVVGNPAPSLLVVGLSSGRHAGLYQRVFLPPNTQVQFSGYFRAENSADLQASLLYIEWKQDGKTHGNYVYTADSSTHWQYLERVFRLPDNSEPWIQFFPVLLSGTGKVWVDNVRVEVLSTRDSE